MDVGAPRPQAHHRFLSAVFGDTAVAAVEPKSPNEIGECARNPVGRGLFANRAVVADEEGHDL